jgi:hypothetical protein
VSAAEGRAGRPLPELLLSALGLAIWAAHFGALYAGNALACERGPAGSRLLGLPFVPSLVVLATLAALVPLLLLLRAAARRIAGPLTEGGEAEPGFTTWFAAASSAYAILAVLFQAAPALMVPPCGAYLP